MQWGTHGLLESVGSAKEPHFAAADAIRYGDRVPETSPRPMALLLR